MSAIAKDCVGELQQLVGMQHSSLLLARLPASALYVLCLIAHVWMHFTGWSCFTAGCSPHCNSLIPGLQDCSNTPIALTAVVSLFFGTAVRSMPSSIRIKANPDSYSYLLPSLTVPANLGVLANDNYTDACAVNTARATLLSVPERGSVALDTDGGFVYTITNSTPPGEGLAGLHD
jgi:hypothetical protein